MARKYEWIESQNEGSFIEPLIKHHLSEGDVHLIICWMLKEGESVTTTNVQERIRTLLKNRGDDYFRGPGDASHLEPFKETAKFAFKDIFGFKPKVLHECFGE